MTTSDSDKRRAYEAALADVDTKLLLDAMRSDLLFERARLLTLLGQDAEAKQAYLNLLRREPTHFGALTNLASAALASGHRSAALTAYRQAAACHPKNPVALVNLANALVEDENPAEACTLYERALVIEPGHAQAHQGLGRILFAQGELAAAEDHWRKGYGGTNSISKRPYRGVDEALRILVLASARDGNIPLAHLLDDRVFATTTLYAEYHEPSASLPPHDVVLNAIGDADLCSDALEAARKIVAWTKAPILNCPKAVLQTGRQQNAARFAQIPEIISPRIARSAKKSLTEADAPQRLTAAGFDFPLLLRTPGYQTGNHFIRVDNPAALPAAASALPDGDVFAIQLLSAAGRDGMIRKYRVMIINGEFLPLHMAASQDWKVHYFTSAMASRKDLRREEGRFLNDMPGLLGTTAMTALSIVRDTLGLDYAGIDFGLAPDGRLIFFEANATMIVFPPPDSPMWDYRRPAISRAIEAAKNLFVTRAREGQRLLSG